eukprot:195407-Amphidinium_carterae.1
MCSECSQDKASLDVSMAASGRQWARLKAWHYPGFFAIGPATVSPQLAWHLSSWKEESASRMLSKSSN